MEPLGQQVASCTNLIRSSIVKKGGGISMRFPLQFEDCIRERMRLCSCLRIVFAELYERPDSKTAFTLPA